MKKRRIKTTVLKYFDVIILIGFCFYSLYTYNFLAAWAFCALIFSFLKEYQSADYEKYLEEDRKKWYDKYIESKYRKQ